MKTRRDQSGRGAIETFTFPEVENKLGTTYFTLLLAVFNIVLYKYTGTTDICVASSMSHRPLSGRGECLWLFFKHGHLSK